MAHILIADDDELIAELASTTLIDAGHACGWVTSGESAWKLLDRKRPDMVLLDQDMPGMSGTTLLRQLRQSPKFYDLAVVMFTAMSGAQDESQAMYAGAQGYVRKPFRPSSLIAEVQRVLSKRSLQPRHTDLRTYLANSSGAARPADAPGRRFI